MFGHGCSEKKTWTLKKGRKRQLSVDNVTGKKQENLMSGFHFSSEN